ncbi:hypothetical protein ON010_g3471 [Phytophthora cinnamomi]|nr:hypothetical protein ON010_g3471 [Phytophthora cinnamomi]
MRIPLRNYMAASGHFFSDHCLEAADIPIADLLALSVTLSNEASPPVQDQARDEIKHVCPLIDHLLAVIGQLIASNNALATRLSIVKAAQLKNSTQETTDPERAHVPSDQELHRSAEEKLRTYHQRGLNGARRCHSFQLNEYDNAFTDRMLETDRIAETNEASYLRDRVIKAKGAETVLRECEWCFGWTNSTKTFSDGQKLEALALWQLQEWNKAEASEYLGVCQATLQGWRAAKEDIDERIRIDIKIRPGSESSTHAYEDDLVSTIKLSSDIDAKMTRGPINDYKIPGFKERVTTATPSPTTAATVDNMRVLANFETATADFFTMTNLVNIIKDVAGGAQAVRERPARDPEQDAGHAERLVPRRRLSSRNCDKVEEQWIVCT